MRIGIDIGGTAAKLALIDGQGVIIARESLPTGREISGEALVAQLAAAATGLIGERKITSAGVASPGYRREDGQAMVNVVNLPGLDGFPLRARLQDALQVPVALDNDANAAALGEHRFGGGRESTRLLVVTVGTGVGAGMVVNGEVLRVTHGGLGDAGHVLVSPEGPRCACGAWGCMEAVAAAPAILRVARELAGDVVLADFGAVVAAAQAGEASCQEALTRAAGWLAQGLASLAHVLGPDRILLGGGAVDAAGDLLTGPFERRFREGVMPFFGERIALGRAELGNDAGLLGAVALV